VNTDLVERARDGDVAAYEALARGMAPRLFRIAFRIVRDAEAAQDVMQQALIAMWRDLPRLRDAEVFEAWACRLAVNAATVRDPSRSAADRPDSGSFAWPTTSRAAGRGPDASAGLVDRDEMERAFARLTPTSGRSSCSATTSGCRSTRSPRRSRSRTARPRPVSTTPCAG
jgi:DNA-directed RNA polymerase specialized sigma24 family protein